MIIEEVLDVTMLEPKLKHPTIFSYFDKLDAGESFIIDNDHDPKPLYFELIGERGNIFSWEYLEQGPEHWRVVISKNSLNSTENSAISESDIKKAELIRSKGIEFNCSNDKPTDKFEYNPISTSQDLTKWSVDFIANHITKTHHPFLKSLVRVVEGLTKEVADHHGAECPELIRLSQYAPSFYQNLLAHIQKVENHVIPSTSVLLSKKEEESSDYNIDLMKTLLSTLQKENVIMNEDLAYFRRLTNGYSLPKDACDSHSYLYKKLNELEKDLQLLIFTENEALFPKISALEKEVFK